MFYRNLNRSNFNISKIRSSKKTKGFLLLETFMIIIFSLVVAAVAAASVIYYKKTADLENQITDSKEILTNLTAASTTSSTWFPPNVTNTNVITLLGNMQALPYSLQSQYNQTPQPTTFLDRMGGTMSAAILTGGTQMTMTFTGVQSDDCDELADSLLLPGIVSLTIGGVNQPLGPASDPSSRDPSASSYATSCVANNQTLVFTYQKQPVIIDSGISDVDFSDPSWVVGPAGQKVTGTGITATGSNGTIVSGPGTSFDQGLYSARIYANDVQASVNVKISYVPTSGGAATTVFYTTDQSDPQGSLVGTSQYIQGLGFNPESTNTASDAETFVTQFNLPSDATSVTITVTSNNGKPITITRLTIYPVNPDD